MVWFTGLSACGKSTVANLVDHKLWSAGMHSFVLDGDNIRHGLNAAPGMLKERHGEDFAKRFGLGFSARTAKRISAALARSPNSLPRRASSPSPPLLAPIG